MSPEVIDQLDDILEKTPGAWLIEDVGELLFGGPLRRLPLEKFFDGVIESGTALRKYRGLPLAVPAPPEIGFFLISWVVERLQDAMIGEGAKGIDKVARRMEKIERRHGVDDMILPWKVAEAPPA